MDRTFAATAITVVQPQSNYSHYDGHRSSSNRMYELEKAMDAAASGYPTKTFGEKQDIRIVSVLEYKEAALALAEAFAEDDVSRYFLDVPDRKHMTKEDKWNLHVKIFEYIVYSHCMKGLVTTTGSNYAAVALWMPPKAEMDWYTELRSGTWRLRYQLSHEGRKRYFDEFMPLLHDTKAATLGNRDEESWYLVYIGTRPSGRGKGYARKLIEHITSICDEEGRPMYLESSNAANPAIYRKYGFEGRRTVHLQRDAKRNVELDIMVREPRPASVRIHHFTEKIPLLL